MPSHASHADLLSFNSLDIRAERHNGDVEELTAAGCCVRWHFNHRHSKQSPGKCDMEVIGRFSANPPLAIARTAQRGAAVGVCSLGR